MNSKTLAIATTMILMAGALMLPLSIGSVNADDSNRKGGVCVIKAQGGECDVDFKNIKNLDLAIPIKVIVQGSGSQENVTQIVNDAVSQAIAPLASEISGIKSDVAGVKSDVAGLKNSTEIQTVNQRLDGLAAQVENLTSHAITNVTVTNGTGGGVVTPPPVVIPPVVNNTGNGSGTNGNGSVIVDNSSGTVVIGNDTDNNPFNNFLVGAAKALGLN